jgi:hypothetical protein
MNRDIEHYLPFHSLLWHAATQPFWDGLAWLVDLLSRVKLRQMEVKK